MSEAIKLHAAYGVTSLVLPNSGGGLRLPTYKIYAAEYNNRSGGARYLHLFNGTAVPADTSVPILAPIAAAANATGRATYEGGVVLPAAGLVAVVSSTKDTLTGVGGATDDIILLLEQDEAHTFPTLSVAGDLTTAVTGLQVWADSAGPKKLYKLEVRETAGNAVYIQLFAHDSPSNGDVPLEVWPLGIAGRVTIGFGPGGRPVYSKTGAGVLRDGCTVSISTTAATRTVIGGAGATIRASYA